jgi:hypothetical protein
MDAIVVGAVSASGIQDPDLSQRWLDLVNETYKEHSSAGELNWDQYQQTLRSGAAGGGIPPDAVDMFVRYLGGGGGDAPAPDPGLPGQSGLPLVAVLAGEVDMGDKRTANVGGQTRILWTTAIAGCVGVAITDGQRCFLAHYTPPMLADDTPPPVPGAAAPRAGTPTPLDNEMAHIAERIELNGAAVTLASPSQGVGYYRAIVVALRARGANIAAEHNATSLAIRATDGTIYHGFPQP